MPYVRRDVMGRIESVHRSAAVDAVEYLDSSDPELKSFLGDESGTVAGPQASVDLLPVLEEVLRLFLSKGLVSVDELSERAQATWSRALEAQSQERARRFSASGFVEIIDDSAFSTLAEPR